MAASAALTIAILVGTAAAAVSISGIAHHANQMKKTIKMMMRSAMMITLAHHAALTEIAVPVIVSRAICRGLCLKQSAVDAHTLQRIDAA